MTNDFSIVEKIIIERNKKVDNAVLMEIQKIAKENEIETKFILNEKAILNALEKQIPKKPIKIGEEYSEITRKWEADYECASCGNPYIDDSYCSCCGQALDWSDTE